MRASQRILRSRARVLACAVLAAASALAGCGGDGDGDGGPAQAGLEQRIATTQSRIVALIGTASCTASAQCAALPMGAKPCGGPAGHLAYSTVASDPVLLQSLADEHAALSRELNRLLGLASDCSVVMPAPLACVQGRCAFVTP